MDILAAPTPERPNFVIFLADDLGWADVPWHGSPYHMPNLEQLGREGVRLEAHYVHPMCSPTRTALMTGRYASRFGVTAAQNNQALPFGTPTLASLLKKSGYDTAIVGKWHLGSKPEWGPRKFGFDFSYGSLAGGCGPYDHRYKEGILTKTWHRNDELIIEKGHVTDLIAREAAKWLERAGSRPFLLYVPFTAIHVPMDEPDVWKKPNEHLAEPGKVLRAACATHMDHAMGEVLKALDSTGLRERTLVLFLSDNGAHGPSDNQGGPYPGTYSRVQVGNNNTPLRGYKSGVYEGGIRTPGIAHWPGVLKSRDIDAPLHAVDWVPTLCKLAGAEQPRKTPCDGIDIWPVLQGEVSAQDRTIYSTAPGFRASMVRHSQWKLVVTKLRENNPPREELFNLAEDLGENHNLATQHPDILAVMRDRLAQIASLDNQSVASDR